MNYRTQRCFFLKVGSYENIKNLYEKGEVYLNTLRSFRDAENQEIRDEMEGTIRLVDEMTYLEISPQGKDAKIIMTTNGQRGIQLKRSVLNAKDIKGNAYCLYSASADLHERIDRVDSRVKKFGEAFIVVYGVNIFIERVANALLQEGFDADYKFVEYYDPETYPGRISPFHKPKYFQHQNEYRFYINNPAEEAVKVFIGPLGDIAEMYMIDALDTVRFEPYSADEEA